MGCSPSHAVIINSSPTHETICLQPRIYMVSESTLCLLRDVGELTVYHVDEKDPNQAVEKFQGAQDQLQNPLLFHPQLRRRERMNTEELQSLVGTSNVGKEAENEEIKDNAGDEIEMSASNEERGNDVDHGNHRDFNGASGTISEDLAADSTNSSSSNAHSVTVEVYSYKMNAGKSLEDGGTAAKNATNEKSSYESLYHEEIQNENASVAIDVLAASEASEHLASVEQTESALEDSAMDVEMPETTVGCPESAYRIYSAAKQKPETDATSVSKAQQKAMENEAIVELDGCDD